MIYYQHSEDEMPAPLDAINQYQKKEPPYDVEINEVLGQIM